MQPLDPSIAQRHPPQSFWKLLFHTSSTRIASSAQTRRTRRATTPGDWQGTCTLGDAPDPLRPRQVRFAASLMWGRSSCRAPNFGWWSNIARKRYAAPQTKTEEALNRAAACWSSPRICNTGYRYMSNLVLQKSGVCVVQKSGVLFAAFAYPESVLALVASPPSPHALDDYKYEQ